MLSHVEICDNNPYVYILANKSCKVIYVGYSNELRKRIYSHKKRLIAGFTKKYNVDRLVYFERCISNDRDLQREKQIKGLTRDKKEKLIERMNPDWNDLYDKLGK